MAENTTTFGRLRLELSRFGLLVPASPEPAIGRMMVALNKRHELPDGWSVTMSHFGVNKLDGDACAVSLGVQFELNGPNNVRMLKGSNKQMNAVAVDYPTTELLAFGLAALLAGVFARCEQIRGAADLGPNS